MKSTVLKDIAMVMLNINIWSGQRKMAPTDFINVDVGDLPPSKVASFGNKLLIDKDRLRPLMGARAAADRLCNRYGTRLLGGYAIPLDCIEVVSIELDEIMKQFDALVEAFMGEYDNAVSEWIKENSEFAEPLRRSMLPAREVRSRFKAAFSIFEISASTHDRTNSMDGVSNELLDSVLSTHVHHVKSLVLRKENHNNSGSFRTDVRGTIKNLAGKLSRFAFCDPSGGLQLVADDLFSRVNGDGSIRDAEFLHLMALLKCMVSIDDTKKLMAAYSAGAKPPAHLPHVQSQSGIAAITDVSAVESATAAQTSASAQQELVFELECKVEKGSPDDTEIVAQANAHESISVAPDSSAQNQDMAGFSFDFDDEAVCFKVNGSAQQETLSQSSFVGDFDKFADTFDF